MKIVDISVQFPSGMTISDRASFNGKVVRGMFIGEVLISERLSAVLREFSVTEAPPSVSAVVDGQTVTLAQTVEGHFVVVPGTADVEFDSTPMRLLMPFIAPTKDQRQQFGRFCHTLAAAAVIGAIGFWHSTQNWTLAEILSEANLVVAFVITFYAGMRFMKGE